ncbi:MAG TPA: sigma-70 family RNA polymerase sigma factor [Terriglobales bacterium]|nr:sigma-70 family RNA polymerase sigma factor [Terriglobales bacterium]
MHPERLISLEGTEYRPPALACPVRRYAVLLGAQEFDARTLREIAVSLNCGIQNSHPVDGSKRALEEVLVNCRPQLFWHAFRILSNHEDAEDALQQAFLSALRHFDQFEGRSKLSTWLTRVVINAALMVRRGKHGDRETSLENWVSSREDRAPRQIADLKPDPEQICGTSEIGALIWEKVDLLPPPLRAAFQLRYMDGMSCEEAAQSLGITPSALKARVLRARREMASRLHPVHREHGRKPRHQATSSMPPRLRSACASAIQNQGACKI